MRTFGFSNSKAEKPDQNVFKKEWDKKNLRHCIQKVFLKCFAIKRGKEMRQWLEKEVGTEFFFF